MRSSRRQTPRRRRGGSACPDAALSFCTETGDGVVLNVRVIPRARKSEAGGIRGDSIIIRLAAPPVEGAANAALIAFLADALSVPRRALRLLSGERGRQKRIAIAGVTADQVAAALGS